MTLPSIAQSTNTSVPHYTGSPVSEGSRHDGGLRPVVGVNLYQVTRGVGESTGGSPTFGDGVRSDIRHHPNIAFWNDRYWVQYLPASEAVLASSADGVDWQHATAFGDLGTIRGQDVATHHRASFYVDEPTGRMLTTTFYGTRQGPNNAQGGFVRAVREVTGVDAQGRPTLGQTYGLLYNDGFEEIDELDPFTTSNDADFVAAANRMLDDRLYSQQFYEEHRTEGRRPISSSGGSTTFADYGFVIEQGAVTGGNFDAKAFNYWTLPDGRIAAVWKGVVGVTDDGAEGWTESNISRDDLVFDQRSRDSQTGELSITQLGWHGTAKVWGQALPDGASHAYALIGNFQSTEPDGRRWPLVISTSEDGIEFDGDALVIDGETPIQRYPDVSPQDHKDAGGAQYIRGIVEGNPRPTDATWLTYSSNKEDIWVARVPNAVTGQVTGPVVDDFQSQQVGGIVTDWNTYSPVLAPVRVVDEAGNHMLRLEDADPYDYARASRVFETATTGEVSFRVRPHQTSHGGLFIDVQNASGQRPVQLAFLPDGTLRALNGPPAQSLNFDTVNLASYHNQDGSGGDASSATISDGGRTVTLEGNAWKFLDFDYTITENTVLAFDFMSTREAELQGIGFDNNNSFELQTGFKLVGTQDGTEGIDDRWFEDYNINSGWESYRIDVGNFFQGDVDRMVLFNDDDAGSGSDLSNYGNSSFRDIMVFEDDGSALTLLSNYSGDEWIDLTLRFDADSGTYDVLVNGELEAEGLAFAEAVDSLERVSFTTGEYRGEDMARRPIGEMVGFGDFQWLETNLPGADTPVSPAVYDLDNFAAVPEPASAALLGLGALGLLKRRGSGSSEQKS